MPFDLEAYNFYQVCEKMGVKKADAQNIVERNFEGFPFNVIRTGMKAGPNMYIVPRKQVDDFFAYGKMPHARKNMGKKDYSHSSTEFRTYTFRVPMWLDEKFNEILRNINLTLSSAVSKEAWVRLALEEFIERRPEFQNKKDAPEETKGR